METNIHLGNDYIKNVKIKKSYNGIVTSKYVSPTTRKMR